MRWRYYDPQTGRFLTKDPIGYAGGLNLYGYAGGNPANYVDPLGLARIGNYYIPNGTIAAGATTAGVMLLGGPVTWAVGGGWAVGAAYSYFVDRRSGMDALADGASGALIGWGGVTAAQAGRSLLAWRAAAGAGAATQTWGPHNGPGPVGMNVATTFRGCVYQQKVTTDWTTMYRAYGGTSKPVGSYLSLTPPSGPLQAQLDSAINPAWGNTLNAVAVFRVPPGLTYYVGAAAPQPLGHGGILFGGGNQVYMPFVDPSWMVR